MDDPENKKWQKYVQGYTAAYAYGRKLTTSESITGPADVANVVTLPFHCQDKPVALLCSPHPDDETLTGVLPYRLSRENGIKVINIALTLGSAKEHRARRLQELERACEVVGFEVLVPCSANDIAGLTLEMEDTAPAVWQKYVSELVELFVKTKPDMVFLPHAHDSHPTHIASHYLSVQALEKYTLLDNNKTVALFETEFWHPMLQPNMLVGVNSDDLSLLIRALNCHQGEVKRNPYHLRQPPRLMDNVRRGSEIIGQSRQGLNFLFGELYRLSILQSGAQKSVEESFCVTPNSTIGMW